MEVAKTYTYCPHGRVKELVVCRQCCEVALARTYECVSLDKKAKKARSKFTDAKVPCEHSVEKRRCKICKGSWICAHGKNKVYCRACDGRRLCQVCYGVTLPRCYETCGRCRERAGAAGPARRVARI